MTHRNSLTDVPGLRVGQAHDGEIASGVTAIIFDTPATAGVAVLGGAPAGRDLGCLAPDASVDHVDAIVLSGGSGFGLDAAGGVQAFLRENGRGFRVGPALVPIVPQAICFDLLNGGNKDWGRFSPYRDLGYAAAASSGNEFALGSAGGGYGATTVDLKGGVGTASARLPSGVTVGAIVVVNAIGSAVINGGPHFWAAPWEESDEFGGLGLPATFTPASRRAIWKGAVQPATTIALVATDAILSKSMASRMAIAAHDGLARALRVTHAPFDGDTVFAASTRRIPLADGVNDLTAIGSAAADCLARAIARGVHAATALPFPGALPAWRDITRG